MEACLAGAHATDADVILTLADLRPEVNVGVVPSPGEARLLGAQVDVQESPRVEVTFGVTLLLNREVEEAVDVKGRLILVVIQHVGCRAGGDDQLRTVEVGASRDIQDVEEVTAATQRGGPRLHSPLVGRGRLVRDHND